jgi:hypothetical protein
MILTKAVLRVQFGKIGVSNALQHHIQRNHMSIIDEITLHVEDVK